MGASAGGHLASLAGLAPPGAFEHAGGACADESSAVQAVVAAYAPIDFLQLDAHRAPPGTPSDDPEHLPMPPGILSADPDSFESLLLGAPIAACPERVREANPLTYLGAHPPPFLILHGLADTSVPPQQSELLFEALAARRAEVTLVLAERLGHGFLTRTHLDDRGPARLQVRWCRGGVRGGAPQVSAILPLVQAFFRAHLGAAGATPGAESA
jgi:acetyl esterase/lipase